MQYNDYELVSLAKEGNEDAINLLYQKYKPIVVGKSKDAILIASHHGIEINDIMQEGYIGLEEAINALSTYYWRGNIRQLKNIANTECLW